MDFSRSAQSTVGIEWELQLIDQDSNDLRQAAGYVMEQLEGQEFIQAEMLMNTIEVTSGVHETIAGCIDDIRIGAEAVRKVTDPLRIDIATAGSHPFANPAYQRVTDSARYEELVNRTQYWGRQMLLFGTHVHVGINRRDKVLPILRAMLTRGFHIQALSSSSPYWAGEHTKYASNRAMVFQQLPTAGTPRQFEEWHELEQFTTDLQKTGVIQDFNEVRWDIRPSPGWGTLETRVCDANTNVHELQAIAALIHCLVDYYSTELDEGRELPTIPEWYVNENKWRSSRYGMDAVLIVDREGNQEPVTDTVNRMLRNLEPTAAKLGCLDELSGIYDILELGAAYQRFIEVANRNEGSLDAVVEHMRSEMREDKPLPPAFTAPHRKGPR
ncbi:glutamate--cysteine ligase [Flaviflexus massiliensis]|uniref:glutamate--cysteine ligase n=1 Tax=Flaviflexus massiliensis TaxID=1522309 RepID=UPI0006D540DC|nr:glutamate--cysteine ligase [Flaviflexus massiliensis]